MKHHINWIEVATPNAKQTRDFFGKVFGWSFLPEPMPDYHIFDAGAGPMGAMHGYMQSGQALTAYIYAPDIDAKLKEIEASGGKVISPKMFIGDHVGNIAHFSDPNGNKFGLWDRERFGPAT